MVGVSADRYAGADVGRRPCKNAVLAQFIAGANLTVVSSSMAISQAAHSTSRATPFFSMGFVSRRRAARPRRPVRKALCSD